MENTTMLYTTIINYRFLVILSAIFFLFSSIFIILFLISNQIKLHIFMTKNMYNLQFLTVLFISLILIKINNIFCDDIPPLPLEKIDLDISTIEYPNLYREYFFHEINPETIALIKIVKKCDNLADLNVINKKLQQYEPYKEILVCTNVTNNNLEENEDASSFKEKLLLFCFLSLGISIIGNYVFFVNMFNYYVLGDIAFNLFLDQKIGLVNRILLLEDTNWLGLRGLYADIQNTDLPDKYGLRL